MGPRPGGRGKRESSRETLPANSGAGAREKPPPASWRVGGLGVVMVGADNRLGGGGRGGLS